MSSYNHLDVSENGDVIIVRFKRYQLLVDERVVHGIGGEFHELASAQNCRKLVVDSFGVEDISSLMLGQLVKLRTRMAAKKGKLVLCGLSPEVREFFDETMLSQLFEIRESKADAIAALA